MKQNCLYLLITISLISSCNKLAELITFNINTQTSISVNSATLLNTPFEINTPTVATNSSQEFENNHTNINLIKKVVLDEVKLTITNPQDKTFGFLKSIHVYISTDAYDEVELAYMENIPADASSITLITTKESLDKFLKGSTYKLRTRMETRETLTQTTDIQVNMKFAVTAGLL